MGNFPRNKGQDYNDKRNAFFTYLSNAQTCNKLGFKM